MNILITLIHLRKVKRHGSTRLLFFFPFLLFAFSLAAQDNLLVSGTVASATDNTLIPGANIIEKGTSNGTSSDFDGNFSFTLTNPNATIIVSSLGFKTKELTVSGGQNISIILEEDLEALSEVVVVGYGTVKRKDLTGAVATVNAQALTERNLTNPLESLQGNVAGVQISSPTGRIGDGFNIAIRGQNTFGNNTNPLFVVDGVPLDNIDFLNPQDIAQMDVLKDASSTAIYGSRATNGVVIITTKSGKTAKSGFNVSFDSFAGIKEVARLPDFMNGQAWWTYHQSAYLGGLDDVTAITKDDVDNAVNINGNPLLFQRAANGFEFDWADEVLKTGFQQNNYVNISGRSENGLAYNMGLGMQSETGNIDNESIDKYTLKVGLDHTVNSKISTGLNLTLAQSDQQLGSSRAMESAFRFSPLMSPYGFDGELIPFPGRIYDENGETLINKTGTLNPLLDIAGVSDKLKKTTTVGNIYLQYKPLNWLALKSTFSGNIDNIKRRTFNEIETIERISIGKNRAERLDVDNYSYTWDNQFNINYTYKENHNFKLLGLQSVYVTQTERAFVRVEDIEFDTGFYNLGVGTPTSLEVTDGFPFEKSTLESYAFRLNYSYNNKYLLTLATRWDGSSLFSSEKRWDTFPSAAVAWNISEEGFMQNVQTVSNLKFRAGFGFTGNNAVDPYATFNVLNQQTFYDFNGQFSRGNIASKLGNKDLGWEKTREVNLGVDFGLLKNKITGSIDVYDKLSEELLLVQDLPLESGLSSVFTNVGSVSNKGVEILLNTTIVDTKMITWENTFTFTKNVNEIKSIYNDSDDVIGNGLFIGESINSYYNFKFDGIWQEDEADLAAVYGQEEGQAKVVDVNNDQQITDEDRVVLGNSDPDWSGSWFTKLRVGSFDLSASIVTNQGVLAYSPFHEDATNTRQRGRQKLDVDVYIPRNSGGLPYQPSNMYPQGRNEGPYYLERDGIEINGDRFGVGFYRDASFVKVKNIALGYTLDSDALERIKIKSCRIYVNVLNPFVFTDYDGFDPEWATSGFELGRVASVTYQLGVNLKL
ncbi:SusC/RagA family TonB-linked outer membrane protein [Aquimarina sp. W85]|uniref:SusC/RagA family TonB-linked outer membrane protein n=1 Tax=Aquimarina rhodophyticola TaxID=3342246 RepID=UPI00366D2EE5